MNKFALFKERSEGAYLDAQTKLIALRQQLAKIIAEHGRESKRFDHEHLAPEDVFYQKIIAAGKCNLLKTESHVALLYSVKEIAQDPTVSIATKTWEADFCKIAKDISENISSDLRSLDSIVKSLDIETAIALSSNNASHSHLDALIGLLKRLIANACDQVEKLPSSDLQAKENAINWLQTVRTKYANIVQKWTDRAQIARNERNNDIANMADSRRKDYQTILEMLNGFNM
jgi:hypothetical protein